MKISRTVKVKNPLGLHARPAALIVKILQESTCSVSFTYRKETINARSIMSILMLAAGKNSVIKVDMEGEDAELTMNKIIDAFEHCFGE